MAVIDDVGPRRSRRSLPGTNLAIIGAYTVFIAAIGFTGAVVVGLVP